jgi:hypothetical protein
LSEESNDAYLLKKIKVTKRKYIISGIAGCLGLGLCSATLGTLLLTNVSYVETYMDGYNLILIRILFVTAIVGWILSAVLFIMMFKYYAYLKGYYKKLIVIPKQLLSPYVCPNCKKPIPKEFASRFATFCISCDYNLSPSEREIHKESEKLVKTTRFCSNCKKTLPEGNSQFCIYCGKPVKP